MLAKNSYLGTLKKGNLKSINLTYPFLFICLPSELDFITLFLLSIMKVEIVKKVKIMISAWFCEIDFSKSAHSPELSLVCLFACLKGFKVPISTHTF